MASPFVGKDGSRHTNRDSMKHANARFASKQPAAKQSGGDGGGDSGYNEGAEEQAMGGADGAQDGAAMAAEHGPATEIDMQHDHENGRHTVHAVHSDGHQHESEHGSAGEAHKFAADLAGGGSGGGEGY
jgi:hypothetical protein